MLMTVREVDLWLCLQSVFFHAGVLLAHNLRGSYLFRILPFDLFPFGIDFTELLAVVVVHVACDRVLYNWSLNTKSYRCGSTDECFQSYCLMADLRGIGIWGEI